MRLGEGTVGGLPFIKVLDDGEVVGWGSALYTYSVYIEAGTTWRPRTFARRVHQILADERGWIRGGKVSFQRVEQGATTWIVLAKPQTTDALCAPLQTLGEVSCCLNGRVVLNVERWKHAVPHWTGSVRTYRQYLVGHEMGHRLGKRHAFCPGAGELSPVMAQQTYGLSGCRENSWPLDSEL